METPTLIGRMLAAQTDPKVATVLRAGYETFLQFGLRRASMQDIATNAGMSRAALYLYFKNKDDIYRAVITAYFAAAADAAEEALTAHENVSKALTAAFEAQLGDVGEQMMRSAHADELLSLKQKTSDAMLEGRARLAGVYAKWLQTGVQSGRIDPLAVAGSAERTAQVMQSALDGVSVRDEDWAAYLAARRHLARIFARAIEMR